MEPGGSPRIPFVIGKVGSRWSKWFPSRQVLWFRMAWSLAFVLILAGFIGGTSVALTYDANTVPEVAAAKGITAGAFLTAGLALFRLIAVVLFPKETAEHELEKE